MPSKNISNSSKVNAEEIQNTAVSTAVPTANQLLIFNAANNRYQPTAQSGIDHGSLGGLTDDDHSQYFLADGSRNLSGDLIPDEIARNIGSEEFPFNNVQAQNGIFSNIFGDSIVLGSTGISTIDDGNLILAPDGGGIIHLSCSSLSAVRPLLLNAFKHVITSQIALGSTDHVSGTLPIANGGTGNNASLNNDRIMISNTGAIAEAAALTNGQILIGSTNEAPVGASISGTANQITVTGGAGTITLSTPQDLHTAATPTFGSVTFATSGGTAADLNYYEEGTAIAIEITGPIADTAYTYYVSRIGNTVTFHLPALDVVGNNANLKITFDTGILERFRPSTNLTFPMIVKNSNSRAMGCIDFALNGNVDIFASVNGTTAFTATSANNHGFPAQAFTFIQY